jgi:hypothetical protein
MALPNQIDPATPLGSESLALGDDQIRAFKQFLCDLFGIPTALNINTAVMSIVAAGLSYLRFSDTFVNPGVAGVLQRNATDLFYHNGTSAQKVMLGGGAIVLAADLLGSGAGTYNNATTNWLDVDAVNLKASVTIPVGAKFLIAGWCASGGMNNGPDMTSRIRILAAGSVIASGAFLSGTIGDIWPMIVAVLPNPTSGAQTIALQFRGGGGPNVMSIFNAGQDAPGVIRPRMWYIVTN